MDCVERRARARWQYDPHPGGQRDRRMTMDSINPSTGETMETFATLGDDEVDACVARASETFNRYRRTSFAERARWLHAAAAILEDEKVHFGRLMAQEMGKPATAGVAEAEKCAAGCRYYADNAERLLADEPLPAQSGDAYIRYLPLGPVLAVMPWNFPFWQVFRFAAPALMAGNVGLLKHASNVPQCALAIEDIVRRAGFPEGAFQTLLIGSAQVARIVKDPRVVAATLTGSEGAGAKVAAEAGANLKKTVLELGGSDPFIVMPSADLDRAVETAVTARTINNGQSCIAAKRFIVHTDVYDAFEGRFVQGLARLKVGDPLDEQTDVGPLATPAILSDLERQVEACRASGARLLTGGARREGPGNFYLPTAIADLSRDAPVYREELFGPVAMLFRVPDIDAAIELANDTEFGLGSSVWTGDAEEKRRFVDEIEAGMTFVNTMVASAPDLPFGGIKRSGYGRELAALGIREFVNIKTVRSA
jgi:succinate-semialdehyde dehydrogenase/glutarate-semialdehyde dehydrogenase